MYLYNFSLLSINLAMNTKLTVVESDTKYYLCIYVSVGND